jgi:hypothetical protein
LELTQTISMVERYKDRIEAYCQESGVAIPPGFYRHSASRYAAVDLESSPPRLVAKTWFNQEDAAYYLANLASGKPMRILDFKDRRELLFNGTDFTRGTEF